MAKQKQKNEDRGMSLDDAFTDNDNVEDAKPKPKKLEKEETKQKKISFVEQQQITIKSSKPIEKIKKGDKIRVDSLTLEVDASIVLQDHKTTKEMAIECFNPKTDKDYQIRYFSDQVENSIEVYELQEIIYNKLPVKKIEW